MSPLDLNPPASAEVKAWDSTQGEIIGQVAIIDMTKRRGRFVFWALRKLGGAAMSDRAKITFLFAADIFLIVWAFTHGGSLHVVSSSVTGTVLVLYAMGYEPKSRHR